MGRRRLERGGERGGKENYWPFSTRSGLLRAALGVSEASLSPIHFWEGGGEAACLTRQEPKMGGRVLFPRCGAPPPLFCHGSLAVPYRPGLRVPPKVMGTQPGMPPARPPPRLRSARSSGPAFPVYMHFFMVFQCFAPFCMGKSPPPSKRHAGSPPAQVPARSNFLAARSQACPPPTDRFSRI